MTAPGGLAICRRASRVAGRSAAERHHEPRCCLGDGRQSHSEATVPRDDVDGEQGRSGRARHCVHLSRTLCGGLWLPNRWPRLPQMARAYQSRKERGRLEACRAGRCDGVCSLLAKKKSWHRVWAEMAQAKYKERRSDAASTQHTTQQSSRPAVRCVRRLLRRGHSAWEASWMSRRRWHSARCSPWHAPSGKSEPGRAGSSFHGYKGHFTCARRGAS